MKKLSALMLAVLMALSLAGCAGTAPAAGDASAAAKTDFKIGIIQLTQHAALDQACKGFQETLQQLAKDSGCAVAFDVQNASGEQSNCATIATKFVNDGVDLILAIATPAAQAAVQATASIPILITAVTDPESAGLVDSNAAPGGNVSGTSDMNPVDKQAKLLQTLVPDVKTVGIMYCSAEDNSILQADLAKTAFEALGMKVVIATAADSNEIQPVTTKMCGEVDAIYIPTDNAFAAAMPTVAMVANPAKIPVICGEQSMTEAGGLATYSIDYYNLGKMTAQQAFDILVKGADISTMPIGMMDEADLSLYINEETAAELGITIPSDLK
ncbi:MAG: ABC transporter substrate-binding protein [Ruthenibacterium sp.]